MNILQLSSELAPLAKSGGLGDAAGALGPALAARGHHVVAVLPAYGFLDPRAHGFERHPASLEIPVGARTFHAGLWRARPRPGFEIWLLEHDALFGRPHLYADRNGDYGDNDLRFALWCRGALALCRRLRWWPDVVHGHDWQAAIAVWAASRECGRLFRSVYTVHNLGYQGWMPSEALGRTGLGPAAWRPDAGEHFGALNLMKLGLSAADHLTTVSPRYALEIQHEEHGFGLDALLRHRARSLTGILNGVDYAIWDPRVDALIPQRYGPDTLADKRVNKARLLAEFGVEGRGGLDAPVVGVVSRLAWQKGIDLLLESTPHWLAGSDARLVVLGSGDPGLQQGLRALAAHYPGRVGVRFEVSERLAHLVEAGADLFAMPSRYEPCGLNQMYSLRYGTVPVVRAVGGLADTVQQADLARDTGTGFVFRAWHPHALGQALRRALGAYAAPDRFRALQRRGMAEDFSWDVSAARYEAVYRHVGGEDRFD